MLRFISLLFLFTSAQLLKAATVTVPGSSDPWLAGMPAGALASGGDTAPANSPVFVSGLTLSPGSALTFSVTGLVNNGAGGLTGGPDGSDYFIPHAAGAENGIADFATLLNSLVGVFLDDVQPDSTQAPAIFPYLSNDPIISPGLKQVFFIGDGLTGTGNGAEQQFVVPSNATRLFLGTMDGTNWSDNVGSFVVSIVPEPSAAFLGLGVTFFMLCRRPREKRPQRKKRI